MRNAECGMRSAECGVRSAECGMRSAEFAQLEWVFLCNLLRPLSIGFLQRVPKQVAINSNE